jgi:hypothetical protein
MTGQVESVCLGTQLLLNMVRDGMRAAAYLIVTIYISPLMTALVISSALGLLLALGEACERRPDLARP